MFEKLAPTPEDPIIKLIGLYKNDPRSNKIDVGIGVFKDNNGNTPIMESVRLAETRIHDAQTTKAYVGLAGDENFNQTMIDLIFGDHNGKERIRAVQTPGGCGALRLLSDMLFRAASDRTIWVSDPTWGNHYPVFRQAGFKVDSYPYLNRETKTVNEDEMLSKISQLGTNDIVLLHGCCHNPTGAELSEEAWDEVGNLAAKNGFFPYVDLAYQGFGNSLSQDAYGVRTLMEKVESMVVAASCSKNFGLYRERVGCALMVGKTSEEVDLARSNILTAARSSYSMPPDHGAAVVNLIMNSPDLKSTWETELTAMRNRILSLRKQASDVLREKTDSEKWDFIEHHRGMFSLLVLNQEQTDALMHEHAVYAVAGGRINIAGLRNDEQLNAFADALVAVTS
ncbi:MAG: aminotransferase class I/II-fold pyridoxal phosphate-dependent enzyme [Gammaproteobacteria bacterium]|nr:aminotransferase class I/II-fold pyridoxal phosphate-dependent enzyme [Gammaproteobacteria bacterium]